MKKHLFTLLLAVVASIGFLSAQITVRLDPNSCASWETVYLWAWTDSGDIFASWPGKVVSKDADGWYLYTFSSDINSVNIIWTNGTDQTIDITNVTTSTCYELNSKTGTDITVTVVYCKEMTDSWPIYNDFRQGIGNWTIDDKNLGSLSRVWTQSSTYGMVASAYTTTENTAESWLISPIIDLTNATYANLHINHALNKGTKDACAVKVQDISLGEWEDITLSQWPAGTNWTFVIANADLSKYIGKNIKIAFVYSSTTANCPQWEIKTIGVDADAIVNGKVMINDLYYNLNTNNLTAEVTYESYKDNNNYNGLTNVYIPNSVTYNGATYSVTGIGDYAFYGCSNLTNIIIPESIKNIGEKAFYACSGIESITIPENLESIELAAFADCKNLKSINWNAIDAKADEFLCYLSHQKENTLTIRLYKPETWNDAYIWLWDDDENPLCNNTIWPGDAMTKIADGLYEYKVNANQVNVVFSDNGSSQTNDIKTNRDIIFITQDDEWYFCLMPSHIQSFTFGDKVKNIPDMLCAGMTNLTSVTFPKSISTIGNSAFHACSSLQEIILPSAITTIQNTAFQGCTSAQKIQLQGSINQINYGVFRYCSSLREVSIPDGIQEVGKESFFCCTNLQDISFGKDITKIGSGTFKGCSSLTTLTLGENITAYGDNAFANCSALTSIYNYRERPAKLGSGVFEGVDYFNCTLYVLAGSVSMYKSMGSDWKDFYFVKSIGADISNVNEITIIAGNNTAVVEWPSTNGANTYELNIKDLQGNTVCKLIFDSDGQLTTISFRAPARNGSQPKQAAERTQAGGFRFTVTGLDEGTNYNLTLTSKDENNTVLNTETIAFKTKSDNATTYTIRFVDYDGTELLVLSDVEEVTIPAYTGTTPTRKATSDYTYTFAGWTPEIVAATADATYTATYTATPKGNEATTYTVTFYDYDKSVIDKQTVEKGSAAVAPADPKREGYNFEGWLSEDIRLFSAEEINSLAVTANTSYTAQYTIIEDGLDDVTDTASSRTHAQKVIINGNLYILTPDGTIFNAQGARVK